MTIHFWIVVYLVLVQVCADMILFIGSFFNFVNKKNDSMNIPLFGKLCFSKYFYCLIRKI